MKWFVWANIPHIISEPPWWHAWGVSFREKWFLAKNNCQILYYDVNCTESIKWNAFDWVITDACENLQKFNGFTNTVMALAVVPVPGTVFARSFFTGPIFIYFIGWTITEGVHTYRSSSSSSLRGAEVTRCRNMALNWMWWTRLQLFIAVVIRVIAILQ